jgi:hypothetical protein
MSSVGRRTGLVRTVGLDLVGPLVVYRVAVGAGMSQVWALVVAGAPPTLGVAIDWIRWRRLDVVGAVVLSGLAFNVAMALVTDSTKAVLLDGALTTAGFGVLCGLSLGRHRPLIFYFAQAFYGGPQSTSGAELESEYDAHDEARGFWRTVTIVWGLVSVVQAAVLVVAVEELNTSTALAVNKVVPWLVTGGLMAWSFAWGRRLRASGSADTPESIGQPSADGPAVPGTP